MNVTQHTSLFRARSLTGAVAGAAMLLVSANGLAESQYSYNSAGTGPVTAQAKVQVTVTVPLLVLLRVGTAGATVDNLLITATPSIPSVPTVPANGSNTVVDWNGAAPAFTAGAAQTLTAYGWTNAPAGASLACAVTTPFLPASGMTPAMVLVSSVGTLAHPGASTACAGPNPTIAPNTVLSSTWSYSLNAAALATATAGSHTQTVTYTATTL